MSRACARDTLRRGNDLGHPERPTPRAVASDREAAPVSPVRSTPLAPAGSMDVTPTRPTGLRTPHRLRASPRAHAPVQETPGPSEPGPLSSRPDGGRRVDRRPRPMWPHAPQPPAADGALCVATISRALRRRVCCLASQCDTRREITYICRFRCAERWRRSSRRESAGTTEPRSVRGGFK